VFAGMSKELLSTYKAIQDEFVILDPSSRYADLVTASTTAEYPIQRWFHFKEAFSVELLDKLLDDWSIDPGILETVIDPFCGSGTSLLAVQKVAKKRKLKKIRVIGIERNPFLQFVANTKASWPEADIESLEAAATHLLNGARKESPHRIPDLTTLKRKDIFDRKSLRRLLGFKSAISRLDPEIHDFMLLGYASAIEEVAAVRKDGRALRVVSKPNRPTVDTAVKQKWQAMIKDLKEAVELFEPILFEVRLGDGRKLNVEDTADLIFYSPPYLNNIDYTEVYKLELWLTGFVSSRTEFRDLRFKTFRSHPSVKFPDPVTKLDQEEYSIAKNAINQMVSALPDDSNRGWRENLFRGYFDDMCQSLSEQFRVLTGGGHVFCVVGNSVHGPTSDPTRRVPVASDLIIASIAKATGFEVAAIQVARNLTRRLAGNEYARESIIVLRKPWGTD
jgi:DNA modification methylase